MRICRTLLTIATLTSSSLSAAPVPVTASGPHATAIGTVNGNLTVNNAQNDAALAKISQQLKALEARGKLTSADVTQIQTNIRAQLDEFKASIQNGFAEMKVQFLQMQQLFIDSVGNRVAKAEAHPEQARVQLHELLVPPAMQFLYGSGEAAALSEQAYAQLVDAVRNRVSDEKAHPDAAQWQTSAILNPSATLERPEMTACGKKPRAVVFDIDETVLLNLGFEYDQLTSNGPFDPNAWDAWERTGASVAVAVPGAVEAVKQLRDLGVAIIFNSNRSARNAASTEMTIKLAGLGQAAHGTTLFLAGDTESRGKDARRAMIAERYCVIAMAGDQLNDFSDLFKAPRNLTVRRAAVRSPALASLWGRIWFMLPNPVYGSGIAGGTDDIFPADKRWKNPAAEQ